MSYILLDTDVWSYLFKSDSRAELYRRQVVGHTPCIAFATVAELYLWAEIRDWGERRRGQLRRAIQQFNILGWDDATALLWAQVRAERQRAGTPISSQDCWIAACALRYQMPLLTHNASHFAGISDLQLLSQ